MGSELVVYSVQPARVPEKMAASVAIIIQSQLSQHMVGSVLLKVWPPLGVGYLVYDLLDIEVTLDSQVTRRPRTFCEDDCCGAIPSELKQSIQLKLRK